MIKMIIDTLGADMGPETIVEGTAKAIHMGLDVFPVLVGPAELIKAVLDREGIAPSQYEIVEAQKYIRNEDPPTCIFGGCDDSSMVIAYSRLKNDPECGAMLSAGSTGALLVGSICRLGLLPGLKFPALASAVPCGNENLVCLVDCGANMDCTVADLVRFAKMGDVLAKTYGGMENPRVGLMNVGREKGKGSALQQEAYEQISQLGLNFVGNLEGGDMVSDYADVIVTDGYAGNLLLKCVESVGKAAADVVQQCALDADPQLVARIQEALMAKFDFNSQGGATFLGPKKTVVKMHGSANPDTVVASIKQVMRLEKARFSQAMAEVMAK